MNRRTGVSTPEGARIWGLQGFVVARAVFDRMSHEINTLGPTVALAT